MSLPDQADNRCFVLPGPASRKNGGCADCSNHGLYAYGAGSSVVIVDSRSMQLVSVLPMPGTSTSFLAPFVTSVRWSPRSISRNILSGDPDFRIILAAGDRQGRVALWDIRLKSIVLFLATDLLHVHSDRSKPGVQDLCWIHGDSWLLASLHGPSLLVLWNSINGQCIWKHDAPFEYLARIQRDPFDHRHFCVLGLKGLLFSVTVLGDSEENVLVQQYQVNMAGIDLSEFHKMEKEASESTGSPALAAFPKQFACFGFSVRRRDILFITFPKELVAFDLEYGASVWSTGLPRGCGKFFDIVVDPFDEILYCAHVDGKLSTWMLKPGEQVYLLSTVEELIPSMGTCVPSPSVLAVVLCASEAAMQSVHKFKPDTSCYLPVENCYAPSTAVEGLVAGVFIMCISDDGKIWKWHLIANKHVDAEEHKSLFSSSSTIGPHTMTEACDQLVDASATSSRVNVPKEKNDLKIHFAKSSSKFNLEGQLHLLSSTITMLAVPSPSLTATVEHGSNAPAAAVPLIALGTQSGAIDIVDASANAVAASFCVHSDAVRGIRWLGNSRLVSFSCTQANDKSGSYINRLTVTCLRSGRNRPFRVLQKAERAPVRALRASSSGRYLVILFRDAPVEVWAMTRSPIMLRSLALPFMVLEWSLPTASQSNQKIPAEHSSSFANEKLFAEERSLEASVETLSESFAFALVNGALGVFEVHGRRIKDFRPKWPSSSFVTSDGLVTAMAYRVPHVVMGDRAGNIRWWDVTNGLSSSFNTHRDGIRRIKFSPILPGSRSRGRIAVLFFDNTFSIYDLDMQDPLTNAHLQPQVPGTLLVELDWLLLQVKKSKSIMLCVAGADSSLRVIEVNMAPLKCDFGKTRVSIERFRPMPLCVPILLPGPHALALRLALQLGIKPAWFSFNSVGIAEMDQDTPILRDLRSYMIESMFPPFGDLAVTEMLLKVLEPYRHAGCLLDTGMVALYSSIVNNGCAGRLAFAAAIFGELSEALFWVQLPQAMVHCINKPVEILPSHASSTSAVRDVGIGCPRLIGSSVSTRKKGDSNPKLMSFEKEDLREQAIERILWHEKLEGEEAIQKRIHELVSIGNLEGAVTLLLSTPPEGAHFYVNALRAIALSSAVSRSLQELAVKVVAANMIRIDKSLSGVHLLCTVGRYQEACSQLQDAGWWNDAAVLAATHLEGSDYVRVLHRWAGHVFHEEHDVWRAFILYVAAGAMQEVLVAFDGMPFSDIAAFFLHACGETAATVESVSEYHSGRELDGNEFHIPGIILRHDDVTAIKELFCHYQQKLVHMCMDTPPQAV